MVKIIKPLNMRKITKEAVNKFLSREPFRKSNMSVEESYGLYKLKLHGNTIATIDELGVLSVSNAGWASNTTKERLNGLPNVRINQKNWTWYLNGNEWSGEWTRVGTV
jgi:hypothetical protein